MQALEKEVHGKPLLACQNTPLIKEPTRPPIFSDELAGSCVQAEGRTTSSLRDLHSGNRPLSAIAYRGARQM
eukprot:scaffold56653_cov14-Tisochrysis_lutea.AAC.1